MALYSRKNTKGPPGENPDTVKKSHYDYLCGALKLNPRREVISFVGAGGKTSAMIRIANELAVYKKKVILTTTTKTENIDFRLIRIHRKLNGETVNKIEEILSCGQSVLCAKRRVKGDKIKGLHPRIILDINREIKFDYMIVEADGSAKKSLKAPGNYEPPVPKCTTLFIPIVGFDILGKKINTANVHRPRMVCRVLDKKLGDIIEPDDLVNIIKNPGGLLKNRPKATRTTVILNKVDSENMDEATGIAGNILRKTPGVESVLCGQLHSPHQLSLFV